MGLRVKKIIRYIQVSKITFLLIPTLLIGGLAPMFGGGGTDPLEGISMCTAFYNVSSVSSEDFHWLYFPNNAAELTTRVPYIYLAGNLIKSGAVDANDCSQGGVYTSGAANTCGLDKALPLVLEVQNIYDDEIINAGLQTGVPPVMLKQQIRYSSQFWPGQSVENNYYGLGHITPYGASTGLLWNQELYQEACQAAYGQPCDTPYYQTSSVYSDPLVGVILDFVNADCPTCDLGFDKSKAEASVLTLAQIDLAHCIQTERVFYNVTGRHPRFTVDFALLWKIALFNYAAGPSCVFETLDLTLDEMDPPIEWDNFSANANKAGCYIGIEYADRITAEYYSFGN